MAGDGSFDNKPGNRSVLPAHSRWTAFGFGNGILREPFNHALPSFLYGSDATQKLYHGDPSFSAKVFESQEAQNFHGLDGQFLNMFTSRETRLPSFLNRWHQIEIPSVWIWQQCMAILKWHAPPWWQDKPLKLMRILLLASLTAPYSPPTHPIRSKPTRTRKDSSPAALCGYAAWVPDHDVSWWRCTITYCCNLPMDNLPVNGARDTYTISGQRRSRLLHKHSIFWGVVRVFWQNICYLLSQISQPVRPCILMQAQMPK